MQHTQLSPRYPTRRSIFGFACSFTIAAIVAACAIRGEVANDQHCWYVAGDATCRVKFGDDLPFCSNDSDSCGAIAEFGCVAVLPENAACHSPCGGGQSALDDDSCVGIADESGSGSASGTEAGASESESSGVGDCGPECLAPMLCVDGECVECTPGDQAACIEQEQWCDPESHSCVECTNHFQCPGGAGCHLQFRTCLPAGRVINLSNDQLSLTDAVMMLGSDDGTIRIHEGWDFTLESSIVLGLNQVVAIVAADGGRPTIDSGPATPEFAFVLSSGYLYLWGLDLVGDAGVKVLGSGKLHAEKTAFDTDRDAISVSGGEAEIRSSMLISTNENGRPTLRSVDAGLVDVTFSTIVARAGDNALVCDANSTAIAKNSILGSFSNQNGLDIGDCNALIGNSATESFFVSFSPDDFRDPDVGDLHLATPTPAKFESVASWLRGDPLDDFDDEPRVTQGKTWAGADHPH